MNNFKQLGLGMHNYESSNGALPPQTVMTFTTAGAVFWKSSWGPTSRITPYMELGTLYNAINYNNKTTDPSNITAVSTQLKVLLCPGEPNQQAFTNTNASGVTATYGVSNYGWCEGTWYTFGGYGGVPNQSLLREHKPHIRVDHRWIEQYGARLGGPDVSTFVPQLRPGPSAGTRQPHCLPERSHRAGEHRSRGHVGMRLVTGPSGLPGGGHAEWSNGNSFYDGFTSALPPNTLSPSGSPPLDSDMSSDDENDGGPTYSAITSRSHHPGGVNSLFADGSVRFIKNAINFQVVALGTIGGGEVISSDSF